MDRRSNDPAYQLHEPAEPRDEEQRLNANEAEQEAVEGENSPQSVHVRQNMNMPAPSAVRDTPTQEEGR